MATAGVSSDLTVSQEFRQSIFELRNGERMRTCIQCSACSGICPFGPWMEFSPRKMIAFLREGMFEEVLDSESVWMCVACHACTSNCPQQVPLTSTLITRTKEELLLSGRVPHELQLALEKTQRYGNPMGESPRKRADWTRRTVPPVMIMADVRRPVDVLWFVGDYASYHPRVWATVQALAKVLHALNVDFAILGREEVSDGDSQRLAGEKGLFEMLAHRNAQALGKYQFQEIITTDPHAYNALKNEYPQLGISYPVKHYTQFLAERLGQLRPLLSHEIDALVTFHDPCYLGRVNGIYEEPRQLLEAIPGVILVEMAHHRADSLCCGGGGGGMWLDGFRWEKTGVRLTEWRVLEALKARPEGEFTTVFGTELKTRLRRKKEKIPGQRILAVACPYEAPRFEDATKTMSEAGELLVRDIAELLAQAMGDQR